MAVRILGAMEWPWAIRVEFELLILLIMTAVFVGGCFIAKLPVALSLVLSSISGALVA